MVSDGMKSSGPLANSGVLILVVMEDGLRPVVKADICPEVKSVLILVVMEDGLRRIKTVGDQDKLKQS